MIYANPNQNKLINKKKNNESMIENIGRFQGDSSKYDKAGKKPTNDISFISQMSLKNDSMPKRPKSTQGYFGKFATKKRKFAKISDSSKQSKISKQSNNITDLSFVETEETEYKKLHRSLRQNCPEINSKNKEELPKKLIDKKRVLYDKKVTRGKKQGIAQIPPSKAFPKELELINQLLITKGAQPAEHILNSDKKFSITHNEQLNKK